MIPDRFIPDRTLDRTLGRRIPRRVQVWATLYRDGWTCQRIALDTGWLPGRAKKRGGTASPNEVRTALKTWGVVLRKPGGRGSIGHSVSVRVAELEATVRYLTGAVAALQLELYGPALPSDTHPHPAMQEDAP